MYEKLMERFTPKNQLLVGAVLFVVGLIRQFVSSKSLDMYAFYFMAAAMLCVVAVIVRKISKDDKLNFILYIILNMALLIVLFVIAESEAIEGMVMYTAWAICVAADWVVNAILITCDGAAKSAVLGFVASLLNVLFIAIVFWVPILISVFM